LATTDHLIAVADDAPAVNLHLDRGRWEASCPGCGYVLAWADHQELAERLATRVTTCPICRGGTAA
jgi:hypothetical protein